MEPLGIAAGTIQVIDHATRVLTFLFEQTSSERKDSTTPIKLEIEIYTKILEEVGHIALSGTSTLPQSAELSLQLCELRLSNLEGRIQRAFAVKSKKPVNLIYDSVASDSLQRGLKEYRRSIKTLRDIVMDAMTQELVRKDANEVLPGLHGPIHIENIIDIAQGTETVERQIESLMQQLVIMFKSKNAVTGPVHISTRFTDRANSGDGLSEDVLKSLRRAAEGVNVPSRALQSTSNPFEFYAKIIQIQELNVDESKVCAKLDTGSEDNWISASIVNRVGLQDMVEPLPLEKLYVGAGGDLFQPTGTLSISWTRNSIKSWQTDFLVLETPPFDMLLGRKFIVEEGLFVFADPVLAADLTRLAPLSEEDYYQMEQNIRERGVQNEELSKTRQAKDAAARQKRRAEKAASRMSYAASRVSLATTPGSVTPSSFRPTPSSQTYAGRIGTESGDMDTSQATSGAEDAHHIADV